MKLALIGDSHAAMVIAAHRAAPLDEDLTVFAKPGLSPEDCRIEGGVLHATSQDFRQRLTQSGAPHSLHLAQHDAIVIAGVAPSAFAAVRLAQGQSVSGWPSGNAAMARYMQGTARPKDRPLMSRAAFLAALTELTRTSLAVRLIEGLRAVSQTPVVFVPQPFPSERLLDMEGKYPIFRRIVKQGDGASLAGDLGRAHQRGFAHLSGVHILEQPADTRRHGCLSAAEYMRAGPRLNEATRQGIDDILHGNADLGARFLADLRTALQIDPRAGYKANQVQTSSNR